MRNLFLAACVAVLFAAPTGGNGCKPKSTKRYTIPTVKDAVKKNIRLAKFHRRKGELAKASDVILAEAKRVLKEYPKAVLTKKSVKALKKAVVYLGNLCLDRSQELLQDAVSNEMWKLSAVFKKRYQRHVKMNIALRKVVETLPDAEVAPKPPPPVPGARPGAAPGAPPAAGADAGAPAMPPIPPARPSGPTEIPRD